MNEIDNFNLKIVIALQLDFMKKQVQIYSKKKMVKRSESKDKSKEKKTDKPSVPDLTFSPYSQKLLTKIPCAQNRTKNKSRQGSFQQTSTLTKGKSASSSKSKSRDKTTSRGKLKHNQTKKTLHEIYLATPPIHHKKTTKESDALPYVKLYEKRELSSSKKGFQKVLKQDPANFIAAFYLGKIAEEQNNVEGAKKYYRLCSRMSYTKKQIEKYAESCLYVAKYHQAREACQKQIDTNPNVSQNIIFLKGRAQLKLGKYGPALDAVSCAIEKNKENPVFYEYQGDCYRLMQAYQVALNSYKKAASFLGHPSQSLLQKQLECYEKIGDQANTQKISKLLIQTRQQFSLNALILKNKSGLPLLGIPRLSNQNLERKMNSAESVTQSQIENLPIIIQENDESKNQSSYLQDIEKQVNRGNFQKGLGMVNEMILSTKGDTIHKLEVKAKILFMLGQFQSCQQTIHSILNASQSYMVPLISLLVPQTEEAKLFESLKNIMNRLKQINAYTLTFQQDLKMMERRKKCLQEALNVFKGKSPSDSLKNSFQLNIVLEQSSIRSSRYYDIESNSIFMLRFIKQTLENWNAQKFSLASLKTTADISYKMVKLQPKEFSIVPLHVLYYTIKQQNNGKTLHEVNEEVQEVLERISEKYPPNEKNISQSTIERFQIKWEEKKKINLFSDFAVFKSYKQVHKAIENLAEKASREYEKMSDICHRYCLVKNRGFMFKIGLKLEKNINEQYQERVLSRIVEKMFKKQISEKKHKIMDSIKLQDNKSIQYYFQLIYRNWENLIDSIIQEKRQNNQPIECHVYDLLRAKCLFYSVHDIQATTLSFIEAHKCKEIYLIEIDNRLDYKTRDVVLKFKIDEIVGELQLALQFESSQNQFSHGLYELVRSPFGGFFASLMWFSGFALKKHRLFLNEKIKWEMKGLENLRKFVYDDKLKLTFIGPHCHKSLILSDFVVTNESLIGNLSYKNKYMHLKGEKIVFDEKKLTRFHIKLTEGNLIVNEGEELNIIMRQQNTPYFITLYENDFRLMVLEDSSNAENMKLRIQGIQSENEQKQIMKGMKAMQSNVYSMIQDPSNI